MLATPMLARPASRASLRGPDETCGETADASEEIDIDPSESAPPIAAMDNSIAPRVAGLASRQSAKGSSAAQAKSDTVPALDSSPGSMRPIEYGISRRVNTSTAIAGSSVRKAAPAAMPAAVATRHTSETAIQDMR